MLTQETYSTLDFPAALETRAADINSAGDVVGTYRSADGEHGFLMRRGLFVSLDFPGAASTSAVGINDDGVIVGYFLGEGERQHGFLLEGQNVEPTP